MAKGHLSEDTVKFIMTAESSELQQEIHKSSKTIDELKKKEAELRKEQAAVKAELGEESKEYKDISKKIKTVNKDIADENLKLTELYKRLGTNAMTMAQLRKEAKNLQRQLDNTSKSLNPKEYEAYAQKLQEVNRRMAELRGTATDLKSFFQSAKEGGIKGFFSKVLDMGGVKGFIAGSGLLKLGGAAATAIIEGARQVFAKAKLFYEFNVEVEEARRLTREFLGETEETLTHTTSQIQAVAKYMGKDYQEVLQGVDTLMHQFGITSQEAIDRIKDGIEAGADVNGTLLSQIQQYAPAFHDAGVSVEELIALITQTRSGIFNEQGMQLIQTATNRIRTMSVATQKALDAIGISSAQLEADLTSGDQSIVGAIKLISERIGQLPEQSQQVGEVMKSVFGKTASNEGMKLVKELASINTNMDELKQVTGEYGALQLQEIDAQAKLNEKMSDTFGIGKGGFEEMTTKANVFILKGLIKTIDYCQSLYDNIKTVRVVVEGVKVTFDTLFKVCEVGFYWIIDIVKETGRAIRDLVGIIEGVLTLDFDQVSSSWNRLKDGYFGMCQEIVTDGKDVGERWGKNVIDSISKVMGKAKIKSPTADGDPVSEVPEVTVTGRRRKKPTPSGKSRTNAKDTSRQEDTATANVFSRDRQADIDEARRGYQEDLNALRQALADKQLLQEQYDAYVSQLTAEHTANLQQIEQSYYDRARQLQMHDKDRQTGLTDQQHKNLEAATQQSFDARLKLQEQYNAAIDQLEKAGADAHEMTLREKEDAELKVLDGYYQAALDRARLAGESEVALTEAYEQAKSAIRNKYARQEAEQEQAKNEKLKVIKTEWYENTTLDDLANQEEKLRQLHEAEEISDAEFQERLKELRKNGWMAWFNEFQGLVSNAVSALQDAELANVDAKYDAEIEAARKAGKDTTELEQKKADEQLKIQKKYADINFAVKCSEIIANTAVSIMKALSELGPIAGPIAAALMGVTGAAQLAVAKAERDKVKKMTLNGASSASASGARVATGLEDGGYVDVERRQDGRAFLAKYDPKKRGYVDRPTVIVGEGPAGQSKEWVASNAAVENPTVRPVLDVLDRAQRAGTVRTLDLGKVLLQQRGLASGGSVGTIPAASSGVSGQAGVSSPADRQLTQRLVDVLERMEHNGIPALVGLDELEARQQLRDNARKIGSK